MTAGSAPPAPDPGRGCKGWAEGLRKRTISGALMGVFALAVLRQGDLAFAAMIAAGALLMAWEWTRLWSDGRYGLAGSATSAIFLAVVVLAFRDAPGWALAICAAGAVPAYVAARLAGAPRATWAALGICYLGPALVALVWLRGHGSDGERMMLWLLLTVVVTDTGAFFAGRLIGGPRLAPRISPKKTWAGLAGAIVGSFALGLVFAAVDMSAPAPATLAMAGAALAVVAQVGDLAESWVKRHFGVKDSSALIPGHGGILDRVDGLVAAAMALALVQWASAGRLLAWGA